MFQIRLRGFPVTLDPSKPILESAVETNAFPSAGAADSSEADLTSASLTLSAGLLQAVKTQRDGCCSRKKELVFVIIHCHGKFEIKFDVYTNRKTKKTACGYMISLIHMNAFKNEPSPMRNECLN